MKRIYWEIVASIVFVLGGTYVIYGHLAGYVAFWDAQTIWSVVLIICSMVIAGAYYRQGWYVHHTHTSKNISILIPLAVLTTQCLLFIKGIFFNDWSLVTGALIVNSGLVFSLYQIFMMKRR